MSNTLTDIEAICAIFERQGEKRHRRILEKTRKRLIGLLAATNCPPDDPDCDPDDPGDPGDPP